MQDQDRINKMQQLVTRWQVSGKSQRAFAAENNLNYYTFRYWVDKLVKSKESGGFIQIYTRSTGKFTLCVRYPNGIELYLPSGTPAKTILQLIRF
jgi:hypothetical protein